MNLLRVFALAVGSLVIFVGLWQAALLAARGPWGLAAGRMLDHATLGLDFFVGATLLNLAINPTWTAVATTSVTIAVRKLLTFSLGLGRRGPGVPSRLGLRDQELEHVGLERNPHRHHQR